jgi:hypothetical protein
MITGHPTAHGVNSNGVSNPTTGSITVTSGGGIIFGELAAGATSLDSITSGAGSGVVDKTIDIGSGSILGCGHDSTHNGSANTWTMNNHVAPSNPGAGFSWWAP